LTDDHGLDLGTCLSAVSALRFSGTCGAAQPLIGGDQRRRAAILDAAARLSGGNPPKPPTEWIAADAGAASIATAASGIIGR